MYEICMFIDRALKGEGRGAGLGKIRFCVLCRWLVPVSSLYYRQGPVRFSLFEVVLSIAAEPSDARGGGLVTVTGAGFDPYASADYACVFYKADLVPADIGIISAAVSPTSPQQVVCAVPAWGTTRSSGAVAVAVLRGNGSGPLVPWVQPMVPEIELFETWTSAGLEGGVPLNATVTAFGQTSKPFQLSQCLILSSLQVSCGLTSNWSCMPVFFVPVFFYLSHTCSSMCPFNK